MKEMYVVFHPEYPSKKWLCIKKTKAKKLIRNIIIVSDLTGDDGHIGGLYSNSNFKSRKATEREIAEGLARRI